jgi:hypothetical protein
MGWRAVPAPRAAQEAVDAARPRPEAAQTLQQADDEARKAREGCWARLRTGPAGLSVGAWARAERRRIGPVMQALERHAGLSPDAP